MAASSRLGVAQLLLEFGADVDAVNIHGNTALHVGCLNGQDIVVSKLIEFHAAVNAVNYKGMVSCHHRYLVDLFLITELMPFYFWSSLNSFF